MEMILKLEEVLEVDWTELMGARSHDASEAEDKHSAPFQGEPEISRGDRLSQFKRQIASLFEVAPDQVDIVIRT